MVMSLLQLIGGLHWKKGGGGVPIDEKRRKQCGSKFQSFVMHINCPLVHLLQAGFQIMLSLK